MTLEELVGQKLVLGIDAASATAETVELFRSTHAGSLILFRRNFESADQLRLLLSDLERSLGRKLLVMVDHEGGRVIHFSEGVTVFPDAQALGISGRIGWARRQGEREAEELRSLGIDVNLAPVLDVLGKERCPAIGTRSYGENPELVAEMGRARITGMQSKGLSACAKHFPGLGSATLDPHGELPVIQKNWKAMKELDLIPFQKAFGAGVETVMSSHPIYPELDSRSRPATFSRRIIHDGLRLELGFAGVALTDDLKMGAISKSVSLREAVPLAAKAGHDLLLICSDPKAQREAFDSLLWAYKKKELSNSELEESTERIGKLKAKRPERFVKSAVSNGSEGKDLARLIARSAARVLQDGRGLLPLSPGRWMNRSLTVLFPDLSPVARERFIEPELLEPQTFLTQSFSQFGMKWGRIEKVSIDSDPKERSAVLATLGPEDGVLFFCWDAHLFKGTRELLRRLEGKAASLIVVLLREPRDAEGLNARTACVTAYGFRTCQIEAAIEKMFSQH